MVRFLNMVVIIAVMLYTKEVVSEVQLRISPSDPGPIRENEKRIITVWLVVNETINKDWEDGALLHLEAENGYIVLENDTLTLPANGSNRTLVLEAIRFGHEVVKFHVAPVKTTNDFSQNGKKSRHFTVSLPLRLIRIPNSLDFVFIICVAVFVIVNNVNMGCVLDFKVIKSVAVKPVGPIVGFLSQFLFMPLTSYGVAKGLLHLPSMQLGLFTLGCCPGGTRSNYWTFLFGGDVNLSVVMTFFSTVAALGMMPLWMFTLGQSLFRSGNIQVPYKNLLISLVSFGAPICVGLLIRRFRPKWANKSELIIRPCTIFILIFFLTVGVYRHLYLINLMTWNIILSGIIVSWGGYVFGCIAALFFCMEKEQVIAISIETALQNPGIAFVLLKVSLPQPDADIAAVSVLAQLMVTSIPLVLAYIWYNVRRHFVAKNKKKENKTQQQVTMETGIFTEPAN